MRARFESDGEIDEFIAAARESRSASLAWRMRGPDGFQRSEGGVGAAVEGVPEVAGGGLGVGGFGAGSGGGLAGG